MKTPKRIGQIGAPTADQTSFFVHFWKPSLSSVGFAVTVMSVDGGI